MNLLEELRKQFASLQEGALNICSLPEQYPAMRIRKNGMYGVAIPCDKTVCISEKFADCQIYTSYLTIDGCESYYLVLGSFNDSVRYEFATLCAEFVDPGVNGIARENLLSEPLIGQ